MATQLERDLYALECAGFAVLPQFISDDMLDEITTAALEFEKEVVDYVHQGGTAILGHGWPLQTTRCLYAVSAAVQDFAMHETVQAVSHGYLGNAIVRDCLLQSNMPDSRNARRGRGGALSFHRDTTWPSDIIRPMYLHVFLLMNDFDADNGGTVVVPGSHRLREPGYYFKHTDPRPPQDGIEYRVYERRYFASSINIEAPRGSVICLDPMTIHTQGINVSSHQRSLLNVTFRARDVIGVPPLLNARAVAESHARVPVRPDLLELLESDRALPACFGPLGH
jgi:ectoine hydroxylase-related dioxygenase (phytanoyl-CoA dioxygenase family)